FLDSAELRHDDELADLLTIIEKSPMSAEAELALLFLSGGLSDHLAKADDIARAISASQILEGRALSAPRAALASAIMSRIDSLKRDETAMHVHVAKGGWITKWRSIGPLGPRTESMLAAPTEQELTGIDEKSAPQFRGLKPPARALPVHRYTTNP